MNIIQQNIRNNVFTPEHRFLGIAIEHLNLHTGQEDSTGQLIVIRMEENINQMWDKYYHLVNTINPRQRPRESLMPLNALPDNMSVTVSYIKYN